MSVTIRDFETIEGTNTPLVGATVDRYAASLTHPNPGAILGSTTTDANGMWEFVAVADGNYDIRISYNSRYRWRKGFSAFSNAISGGNFASQSANAIFAGPSSGGATTPTFRAMAAADVASHSHTVAGTNGGPMTSPRIVTDLNNSAGQPLLQILGGTDKSLAMGSSALTTTATEGFFYVTTSAGAPTGVPITATGRAPLHWDSTNKRLYLYDFAASAWYHLPYGNQVYQTAWTTFAPTISQPGTLTHTLNEARYLFTPEKLVFVHTSHALTGAGTVANAVTLSLPTASANTTASRTIGHGIIYDSSTAIYYPGVWVLASTTSANFIAAGNGTDNTQGLFGTVGGPNIALASGDSVSANLCYEGA